MAAVEALVAALPVALDLDPRYLPGIDESPVSQAKAWREGLSPNECGVMLRYGMFLPACRELQRRPTMHSFGRGLVRVPRGMVN